LSELSTRSLWVEELLGAFARLFADLTPFLERWATTENAVANQQLTGFVVSMAPALIGGERLPTFDEKASQQLRV